MKAQASSQYLRHTKIPTLMFPNAAEVDKHVALVVASLIRENNSAGVPTVLGLPTGSTPIGVYRQLIRLHRDEGLDFSQVITFNLDEYLGRFGGPAMGTAYYLKILPWYAFPAWLGEYGFAATFVVQEKGLAQSLITTAHVASGSLILFTSVVAAAGAMRLFDVGQAASLPKREWCYQGRAAA
jgi:hypothetical protein